MKIFAIFAFILIHTSQSSRSRRDVSETCTTPSNTPGVCVETKDCPSLLKIVHENTADSRSLLQKSMCGFFGTQALVCCPDSAPPTERPSALADSCYECGVSVMQMDRVVNGTRAKPGHHPWIALLGFRRGKDSTKVWLCGGSLVTRRHVVTAGHCVSSPSQKRWNLEVVRLGELNYSSPNDGASPQDYEVQSIISHPEFSTVSGGKDIAIITIKGEANFSSLVHTICLPSADQFTSLGGRKAMVVGWGRFEPNGGPSDALMQAELELLTDERCRDAYASIDVDINRDFLCALAPGKDACQGDSGGPLVVEENSKYYLVGIVSFGLGCASPNYPGVYTRLTSYLEFIHKNIE